MSGFPLNWKKKKKGIEPLHKCSWDVTFANVFSHPLGPRILRPDMASRTDSASVTDVLWWDRWDSVSSFMSLNTWELGIVSWSVWNLISSDVIVFTESSGFCSFFQHSHSNANEESRSYTSCCYLIQVDETLK